MTTKGIKITVGEFKEHLDMYEDEDELYFSGLDFYRLKQRGPSLVQVEFNQSVYVDDNDNVQVQNLD